MCPLGTHLAVRAKHIIKVAGIQEVVRTVANETVWIGYPAVGKCPRGERRSIAGVVVVNDDLALFIALSIVVFKCWAVGPGLG